VIVADRGYSPPMPMPRKNWTMAKTTKMESGGISHTNALAIVPAMTNDNVTTKPFFLPN